MKLYSIEVKLCGTAYIKADNETDALAMLQNRHLDGIELSDRVGEPFSGRMFDDPELPAFSLSPVMTLHGAWDHPNQLELQMDYDNPEG